MGDERNRALVMHKGMSIMHTTTLPNRPVSILVTIVALLATLAVTPGTADAASTVTVTATGDVVINGDNTRQDVVLTIDGQGVLTVELTAAGVTTTDVIGSSYRDLRVNLRGGDDRVKLRSVGTAHFRRATINLGPGDNVVDLWKARFAGLLRIVDGNGSSIILLDEIETDRGLIVNMSSGEDAVTGHKSALDGTTAIVAAAGGELRLALQDVAVGGRFEARGGNGAEEVILHGDTIFNGPLTRFDLRNGDDSVRVASNVEFNGPTEVVAGGGADEMFLELPVISGPLTFQGGGGDDRFITKRATYLSSLGLDGGPGTDHVTGEGNTFAVTPTVVSFEIQ